MVRKNRIVHVQQKSPFLALPGEVREYVYYAALVRPTPIDLWPNKYQEDEDAGCIYRLQKDLEFVRKEMATGLIATCKQIYNEAGNIFWSTNTFRFSGDVFWFGARRFLGTIGPRALAQLHTLELFAPLKCTDWDGNYESSSRLRYWRGDTRENDTYWEDFHAKNAPKMHMTKARVEPWTRSYSKRCPWRWAWTQTTYGERSPKNILMSNVEHVCHLLAAAETSLELKFVLPGEFGVSLPPRPHRNSPIWNFPGPWHLNLNLELPGDLSTTLQLFTKSATLVVEAGSGISVELVELLTNNHLSVLCQTGVTLVQESTQTELITTEPKFWENSQAEFDYLIGFPKLFEDQQACAVPALGGRANKTSGPGRALRVLRGFGGCRFHVRDEWRCAYTFNLNSKWKCKWVRKSPRVAHYKHDPQNPHCTLVKDIVIMKKARAARKKPVNVIEEVRF
jgi:hypothetical protein